MSFAAFGPSGRPPSCWGPIGKVQMETAAQTGRPCCATWLGTSEVGGSEPEACLDCWHNTQLRSAWHILTDRLAKRCHLIAAK